MSIANRPNRKANDTDLIRLNSVGLSLSTIAEKLHCHPTTVTQRLVALGIPPADTRRSFMEDVYMGMSESQREWLINQLGPHLSIKDYVKNLLVSEFIKNQRS